jgi:hypothetical protein
MIHVSVAIGMIRLEQVVSPISMDYLLMLIICEMFILKIIKLISILFIIVNMAKVIHQLTSYGIMYL